MTKTVGKNLGIFAIGLVAICTVACAKDKPEVGTTETTSAEVARPAPPVASTDGYLATVRREQLVLRSRIDDELRTIERRLGELRRAPRVDPKAIDELVEKRETLKADAAVVDRADERGWDELKAVVEHDLEGQPQM